MGRIEPVGWLEKNGHLWYMRALAPKEAVPVYTADQIRKLVEETRKGFPLDPYTLSQELRDMILDALLAQLGEKNGDHS